MKGKLPEGFEKCGTVSGGGYTPEGVGLIGFSRTGEKHYARATLPSWTQPYRDGVGRVDVYTCSERNEILIALNPDGAFRLREPNKATSTVHVSLTDAFRRLGLDAPTGHVRVPLTWDNRGWFVFDLSGYKP